MGLVNTSKAAAVRSRQEFSVIWLQNISLMIVCFWITSPILLSNSVARLIALAGMAGWAWLELVRSDGIFRRPTLPVIAAFLLLLHDLLVWFVFREWSLISRIQFFVLLTFVIVYESRRNSPRSLLPVFWFLVLTLPIWIITTLRGLDVFGDHAVRHVVRSSETALELMQQGVGGYSLVYGVLLLIPILLCMALRPNRFDLQLAPKLVRRLPIPWRVFAALIVSLVMILTIRSGFSIAIMVGTAGFIATIALLRPHQWQIIGLLFLSVLIIVYGEFLFDQILAMLIPLADGTNYAVKLRDIEATRITGSSYGSVADRTDRYLQSIHAFIDNPFLGTLNRQGVGGHSAIMDSYAQRGVLFGSLYLFLLVYLPIRMMRRLPRNLAMTGGVLAVVVIFPLLNSVTMITGVMLFIVFPAACAMTFEYGQVELQAGGTARA